jgi:hypothetical protein
VLADAISALDKEQRFGYFDRRLIG